MELPAMRKSIASKLLVTLFLLWMNLDFSIGEQTTNTDEFSSKNGNSPNGGPANSPSGKPKKNSPSGETFENVENQTGVDWYWESVVAVRWDIGDQPVVRYNSLKFDIDFSVSDYVLVNEHVRYSIYQDAKCEDSNHIITNADTYMNSWITGDDTPIGPGLDETVRRTITVSSQLNPDTISQSKSYKELPSDSEFDASITYCVRFSLWNTGPDDEEATEINHATVTLSLNLILTDDTLSISGQQVEALEKGVETSDDEFFLQSFTCDTDGNHIIRPYSQGETIRICVEPTEQASEVGFRMKEIGKFSFHQGLTSQPAILNGEVATNQLTDLSCVQGSRQCAFETMLFAHFFDNQQGTITGSGEATLQWGGEGVDRRLKILFQSPLNSTGHHDNGSESEKRSLQERTSIKSMALQDFSVFAEKDRRPPLRNKSMSRTQLVMLITLLSVFSTISLVSLISYIVRASSKPPPPTPEIDLGQPEEEQEPFKIVDRFVMPEIPEAAPISLQFDERTVISVKSLFSRASRVSNGPKGMVGRGGYVTE